MYDGRQQCISAWYLHLVTTPVNICRSLLGFSFPSTWRCWCELLGSYLSEVFASLWTAIHDDMTVLWNPHSSRNHSSWRKEICMSGCNPYAAHRAAKELNDILVFGSRVLLELSEYLLSCFFKGSHGTYGSRGYKCLRARRTSQCMFEHNSIQL